MKLKEIYFAKSLAHENRNLEDNILLLRAFIGCSTASSILNQKSLNFAKVRTILRLI